MPLPDNKAPRDWGVWAVASLPIILPKVPLIAVAGSVSQWAKNNSERKKYGQSYELK